MKAIRYIAIALACGTVSTVASSATNTSTKTCVDTFIAQELRNRPADVRIRDQYLPPMPIELRTKFPLELTAVDKSTGRMIATAACDPERGLVEVDKR
jgi:hypothetical protein